MQASPLPPLGALVLLLAGCASPAAPLEAWKHPPVASFHLDRTALLPGQPLHADAGASRAGSGAIAQYRWDFGDGEHEEGRARSVVEHRYALPGRYVLLLTVEDERGLRDSKGWTVGVDDVRSVAGAVRASPDGGPAQDVAIPFPVSVGAQQVALHLDLAGEEAARVAASVRNSAGQPVAGDARDLPGNGTAIALSLPRSQLAPPGAWWLVVHAEAGNATVRGELAVRYGDRQVP